MEIKRPFSWTSCSRGPSEVEGVRRGPRVGGPQGCPAELSASPWRSGHGSSPHYSQSLYRKRPSSGACGHC